jgi:hypothetical protein
MWGHEAQKFPAERPMNQMKTVLRDAIKRDSEDFVS